MSEAQQYLSRSRNDEAAGAAESLTEVDPKGEAARAQSAEAVQMTRAGAHGRDPEATRQAATQGVQGAGTALPFLDVIQASFGAHHDISGISAHIGGQAAESCDRIGATAYATGNSVAFTNTPSLALAAHEAAHVVQQHAGVQLSGGVGRPGDVYERHAEAAANLVVQGKSAAPLLDSLVASGGAATSAVQSMVDDVQLTRSGGTPNYTTPAQRRIHIIDGDATGGKHAGRHSPDPNASKDKTKPTKSGKKTYFPQKWSDDDIIDALEEAAVATFDSAFQQSNGNWKHPQYSTSRSGASCPVVVITNDEYEVWTGWPIVS
jgi:hypothetical protein